MPLTRSELTVAKFLSKFYHFFWPFPIKWNDKYTRLIKVIPVYPKWIPFVLMLGYTLTFGIFSATIPTIFLGNLPKAIFLVQLTMGVGFFNLSLIVIVAIYDTDGVLYFLNGILEVTEKYNKEYRIFHEISNRMLTTTIQFGIIAALAFGTYFVPVAFLFANFDTTYYIAEIYLGDPMHRRTASILTALLLRYIFASLSCLEIFRSLANFIFLGFIFLARLNQIFKHILKNIPSISEVHTEYVKISILWMQVGHVFQWIVCLFLIYIFWAVVALAWVSVKCSTENIGLFFYTWLSMLFGVLIAGTIVSLPLLCNILEIAGGVVLINRLRARLLYIKAPTWKNKLLLHQSKAVHPIRLRYGFFGFMGDEFCVEFFEVLADGIFNAVTIDN